MIPFQNISPGAPNSLLQVAVKNNQQPVWYFNDKIPLHVFFGEDGKMERAGFLEVKSAIMFVWFSCFFFHVWAVNIWPAIMFSLLTVLVDLSHSTVDSSQPCLVLSYEV
jgi:hypothetical protein